MGLSISVGILADLQENDPEMVVEFQKQFDTIKKILAAHGLPPHNEPLNIMPWIDPLGLAGFPYSWIHYLRRYYAHRLAAPDKIPSPLAPGQRPVSDPVLDRMSSPKSHLMWHSDAEGYYVPVDFPNVIEGRNVPGGMLGSSQRLLEELRTLAAPLGFELQDDSIPPHQIREVQESFDTEPPYFIERAMWVILFDAAKASIKTGAAICFG